MKQQKIKQLLKIIAKYFLVCFSVLLAVFSMFLINTNQIGSIEKSLRVFSQPPQYQQNMILQKPRESNKYSKQFLQDGSNSNYTTTKKLSTQFTLHTSNTKNLTRNLRISFAGSIYWWHGPTWNTSNTHYGSTILDAISIKMKTSSGELINKTDEIYSIKASAGQWGWTGADASSNWSHNLYITIPQSKNINDYIASLSVQFKGHIEGHSYGGVSGHIKISKIDIYSDGQSLKNIADFNNGSNINFSHGSPKWSSVIPYSIEPIYTGKKDYYNKITMKYKKIFMSIKDLQNKTFTDDELKKLVRLFYKDVPIGQNRLHYNSITLDRVHKQIVLNLNEIDGERSNQKFEKIKVAIPIIVMNFDYLLETSVMSSSYLKHLPNGDTKYYSIKPITKVRLSENFIKALKISSSKNLLLKKINQDNWGFISNDRNIAISKIKSLALNIDNYDSILQAYRNSHNANVLNSLSIDPLIVKYISSNNFENANYDDYLYVLTNSKIKFDYGSVVMSTKEASVQELVQGINLTILDVDVQQSNSNRTNWDMHIKNLKVKTNNDLQIFDSNFKIDIPNQPLENYDLKLKYPNRLQEEVIHQYLFQAKGIDISKNISFIMEDGSILDQDFRVISASAESKLKVGEYAYVATRYWTTFRNKQKEYLTLIKKSRAWYSPKYKQFITQIDANFNPKKIEYLFNQELQLIINPYSSKPITAKTPQSFGLKRVTDEVNGSVRVLEDWNDGRWSHTTDSLGRASFDGIFGADTNGILDGKGRLKSGRHHINITLQNSTFNGFKNDFYITIDKDPVKAKVVGTNRPIKNFAIRDQNSQIQNVYHSTGPINVQVKDVDIKSVTAQFIDHNGNWYKLPVKIISKLIDGHWVQTINTTIDYAGFAKIIITDQAGNSKTLYFWLQQRNNNENPNFDFANNSFIDQAKRLFNGNDIYLANKTVKAKVSSPLAKVVRIEKKNLVDGEWKTVSNNNDYSSSPYVPSTSSKEFGRTIGSSKGVLKYAGDELKPFLNKSSGSWPMLNKQYKFLKPGLYKLIIQSRIIGHELIELYIYIGNNGLKIIDSNTLSQDSSNFKELPHKPTTILKNIDKAAKLTSKLHLNIPSFIIKTYSVEYSLPWYSEFHPFQNPNFDFEKEGKYKIHILDIYGNKYEYEILVINKHMSVFERSQKNLIPVYGVGKDEKTAFWKGKNIWNYGRYEDEDHAKWEHSNFIKKAIKSGMSKKDAEAIYKRMKSNGSWDGSTVDSNGKDINFKKVWDKWKSRDPNFKRKSHLTTASLTGIIVGSSIGGGLLITLIIWLLIKRIKGRKIK